MKNIYRVSLFVVVVIMTSVPSLDLNAQVTQGAEVSSLEALFDITQTSEGRAAYDPRTGEVFAAIGSSDVLVFGILGASFRLENLNADFGALQDIQPEAIGFLDLAGLPTGVFNLGPILQPNPNILTAQDFAAEFPTLSVLIDGGEVPLFESRMNVLVVPEPSSFIGLMTLLVTGCCTRRRQR